MRFYSFTNANYMSQLQLGLQTAHCVAEMSYRHPEHTSMYSIWAEHHKTMVILNGGNCADLEDLYNFLNDLDNPYPFAKFHEDKASLNEAITCVGIVLPEEVYETAALIRNRVLYCPRESTSSNYIYDATGDFDKDLVTGQRCRFYNEASPWTAELIDLLNQCRLA